MEKVSKRWKMFSKMSYIYAVYKEQSFTKAAEKLFVSQPYLSAAIKRIEKQVGAPLFERRYSSVRPTKVGYEYIQAAEKIMDIERHFTAKVTDINMLDSGSINIGCSIFFSYYLMPDILKKFTSLYPNIDITLTDASASALDRQLNNEEIDLIIDTKDTEKKHCDYIPIAEEKILLAVPASFKCNAKVRKYAVTPEEIYNNTADFSSHPPISLDYFKDENFILLKSGNNMHAKALSLFELNNISPNVSFSLDLLATSYALTASGNGISFVTDTIFKNRHLKDEVLLYNVKGAGTRPVYLIKKKNRYTTTAIKKFIDTIKSI